MKHLLFISAMNFLLFGQSLAYESVLSETKADCLSQILSKRYSGYAFDPSKPVSQNQLDAIMEAARLTPSCYNEQPWVYIICDRNRNLQAYEKTLSTLVEFNQNWARNAPVLIITIAANKFTRNNETNRWAQYDTGAASFSMMLQATSLGLMTHQMGGFDENKIRQLFSIPDGFTPMAVMAIGYPSLNEPQPERKRKPLTDNFFYENWGR